MSTVLVDNPLHDRSLEHEIGGSEVRRSRDEFQDRGRESVGRVGH